MNSLQAELPLLLHPFSFWEKTGHILHSRHLTATPICLLCIGFWTTISADIFLLPKWRFVVLLWRPPLLMRLMNPKYRLRTELQLESKHCSGCGMYAQNSLDLSWCKLIQLVGDDALGSYRFLTISLYPRSACNRFSTLRTRGRLIVFICRFVAYFDDGKLV